MTGLVFRTTSSLKSGVKYYSALSGVAFKGLSGIVQTFLDKFLKAK